MCHIEHVILRCPKGSLEGRSAIEMSDYRMNLSLRRAQGPALPEHCLPAKLSRHSFEPGPGH